MDLQGTQRHLERQQHQRVQDGLLREKGDKSTRVPKGTKIKKIGLISDKDAKTLAKVTDKVEVPKEQEKALRCSQVIEVNYVPLTKDSKFSNCIMFFKSGEQMYASEDCDLIIPKGSECCKVVSW